MAQICLTFFGTMHVRIAPAHHGAAFNILSMQMVPYPALVMRQDKACRWQSVLARIYCQQTEGGLLTYASLQKGHPAGWYGHLHRRGPCCCASALGHQQPRQLQLLLGKLLLEPGLETRPP
jgi:hypothetical protein